MERTKDMDKPKIFVAEDNSGAKVEASNKSASGDKIIKKRKKCSFPLQALKDYQIEDLKKAFEVFDVKNEGKIPSRDLKVAIRACGFEPKKEELRKFAAEFDPQEEGFVSLGDFVTMFTMKLAARDPRDEMLRAFKFFDRDNKGVISFEDLKNCAYEIGETLHDEELQEMIDEADTNGDGLVNQEEFIKIMTKTYYFK